MKKSEAAGEQNLFLTIPQFERLKDIHVKIASLRYPNTKELAQDHDVSIVTISRDIELLRDKYYAPIEYDAVNRGYYYSEEYDFPLLHSMTSKQIQVLTSAKTLLSHYKGTPLYKDAEELIDMMSNSSYKKSNSLMKRIALPPSPEISINSETWNKIVRALESNLVLKFDYNGRWNTKTTHRVVHPYQLLLADGVCYVWGWDETADQESSEGCRLFNLSRMKLVLVTKDSFTLPNDFEFESKCGGGKFGAFQDSNKNTYIIEFYKDSREYVKSCKWADDQKITDDEEKKCTTITFSASQHNSILEWVLAQGANAKPLAPKFLVKQWKDTIRGMMQNAGL